MRYAILSNQAKCLRCGDVIWSAHRHDYKKCMCGAIGVDGGASYIRRSYANPEDVRDQSIFADEDVAELILAAVNEQEAMGKNAWGVTLGVLRAIRDAGATFAPDPEDRQGRYVLR